MGDRYSLNHVIVVKLYHPCIQFPRNVRLSHLRIATFSAHRNFFDYCALLLRLMSLIFCFIATLFQCFIWLTYVSFYFERRRWLVRTFANISKYSIGLSKYCIQSISVNINDIKLRMWKHFVDDCAEHGRVTFY